MRGSNLKWVRPIDSLKPWAIKAPVATIAWTMPRSIIRQRIFPIFAIVIAPETVATT